MADIEAIWDRIARRASIARRRQIPPLREFLRDQPNPHARLLSGWPLTGEPSPATASDLEARVIRWFEEGRLTRQNGSIWFGLIHAAIAELGRRGTSVAQTCLASAYPQPVSPFSPERMSSISLCELWREALHRWIREESRNADRQAFEAAILLSAVIEGALLDPARIRIFGAMLAAGEQPEMTVGGRAFSFRMAYEGRGNHHLQRWFLDPVSEMLFCRLPDRQSDAGQPSAQKLIRTFLADQGVDSACLPSSLRHLVDAAYARLSPLLDQLDLRAERREFSTHSIHPRTWNRLHGLSTEQQTTRLDRSEDGEADDKDLGAGEDPEWVFPWLGELYEALEASDRTAARAALDRIDGAAETPAPTYIGFVRWLLSGHSASGKAVSLTGIRRRIALAVPQLLEELGERDPAEIDENTLEDAYGEIATSTDRVNSARDLVAGLRDFHHYLVRTHKKRAMRDESAVLGTDAELLPVDANLPSMDDYHAAMAWLDGRLLSGWPDTRITQAKLLLVLAFRLGMRRMEALGLRLDDFNLRRGMRVIVQENPARRLKTRNSYRAIPIWALLDWRERRLLRRWIRQRRAENRAGGNFASAHLFSEFDRPSNATWIERTTDAVCDALRAVTGDQRLFVHHLRHGFASWLALALATTEHPGVIEHFAHLPRTAEHLRRGGRIRNRLLGRDRMPTRILAFTVARLLGHSTPRTSLGHYLHVSNIVVAAATTQAASRLPRALLVAASGLNKSSAYDALDRGVGELLRACRKRAQTTANPEAQPARKRGRPRKSTPPVDWLPFDTVMQVLRASIEGNRSPGEISGATGLPEARIEQILGKATTWCACLGIRAKGGLPARLPLVRTELENRALKEFELAFSSMAARSQNLLRIGTQTHLALFNLAKHDVVFHGAKQADFLKNYLKFLSELGLPPERYQWVIRRPERSSTELPAWASSIISNWAPTRTRRVSPPNLQKSASYSQWVGVQALTADGRSTGRIMAIAGLLLIAAQEEPSER